MNKIYTHPSFFQHITPKNHPESLDRLQTLDALFAKDPFLKLTTTATLKATRQDILSAHDKAYVDFLFDTVDEEETLQLDGDTYLSPQSLDAALYASGAGFEAVKAIKNKALKRAFIAARPPGHHAEPHKAMGFCLFNTIFITALNALAQGFEKIALIDFDVHHGNGTDAMMRKHLDKDLLFISSHEWPLFPGSGAPETSITDKLINIALPANSDGTTMRAIYSDKVFPVLEAYQPDLILLSAGFDAHKDDPLASLQWDETDYVWLGQQFSRWNGVAFLEGGYNLDALSISVAEFLNGYFNLNT